MDQSLRPWIQPTFTASITNETPRAGARRWNANYNRDVERTGYHGRKHTVVLGRGRSVSRYVIAFVLRRETFLHHSQSRTRQPALLACMILVASLTSKAAVLRNSSTARITISKATRLDHKPSRATCKQYLKWNDSNASHYHCRNR